MSISAVLITLNEESNIRGCLQTLGWADEVVIVDGGSTDNTVKTARELGATVFEIPFSNFAAQKNEAVERAKGDWVFLIDADERVPEELAREILEAAGRGEKKIAYAVHRNTYFFGSRLRFSGTQSDYPVRLWPRGGVRLVQPVHESAETSLPVKRLRASLIHYSTRDYAQYKRKLIQYTAMEVRVMAAKNRKVTFLDPWLRAAAKGIYLYFVKLGILDGIAGLRYAALSSYYDFLKYRLYLDNPLECKTQ